MPDKHNVALVCLGVALAAALAVLTPLAIDHVTQRLGGDFAHAPEDAEWLLSPEARALIDQAYAGLDGRPVQDHYVMLLSPGQPSAADADIPSYLNPQFLSWLYPRRRLRGRIVFSAAGMDHAAQADGAHDAGAVYLARLLRLARALPEDHRLQLAALDQRYDPSGRPLPEATGLYVSNKRVWALAQAYPEQFRPVISVHPYRDDAIEALRKWHARGVETVLWRPAMQGMDPRDPALKKYYRTLAELDMRLLTRIGSAGPLALEDAGTGNPLAYRDALAMGVRLVMSNAASPKLYGDPDDPDAEPAPAFTWFLELAQDPALGDRLYGDIASLTRRDHLPQALTAVLQHPQLFDHLVYASGYPAPAVNAGISLAALVEHGFIEPQQSAALREIYDVNPLLFDFVLARSIRLPHTDLGLPAAAFTRRLAPD